MNDRQVHREHDVIVVGAGVAGALMAWHLAESGARVLVLEAGDEYQDRLELVGRYAVAKTKTPSAPYANDLSEEHAPSPRLTDGNDRHYIQSGPNFFKSTYERLVGGSTWHWLGNTPRFIPNDFKLHSEYGVGVDWPISYDQLEPWYVKAEHQLGVSADHDEWVEVLGAWRSKKFPMSSIWPTFGDSVVASAIHGQYFDGTRVEIRATPQARNSRPYQGRPPCAGNSTCVPICPIAAKYDATVHVAKARRASTAAEIRPRCVVKRLVAGSSGRIERVEYDRWTPGRSTRERRRATAKIYVLAAHAIETPLILLESGLAREGPVGKNLMDHPQGYGGAVLPEPVYPFRGPPVTSSIDAYRDGAFRNERAAFRISIGNDGWGRLESIRATIEKKILEDKLLGSELRTSLNERVTRMLRFSYSTEMLPDERNRVTVGGHDAHGNPRPKIHFRLDPYNIRSFDAATHLLDQFFDRLGATERKYSHPDSKGRATYEGAQHIVGTCRMGSSEHDSVVDSKGRAHEHSNLFLAGASIFPTSGTANPTLTAAALALRTADQVVRELRGEPA